MDSSWVSICWWPTAERKSTTKGYVTLGLTKLQVFLITDGQSGVGNPGDLAQVADNLNAADVKLNVIAIDFGNDLQFEDPAEAAKAAEDETAVQQHNKGLLQTLVQQIHGKIFPANLAMNIYHQFRKRAVHPVAKYRGPLEISPDLSIQVLAYTKTKVECLPSLVKHSLVAEQCISSRT